MGFQTSASAGGIAGGGTSTTFTFFCRSCRLLKNEGNHIF